ncbi:2-hydroxyacid dehydrogenase [Caldimonas aquatica]|uniref:Glyoxylate/hydroxypyruvate reductase A n=1 Tax=Caldimonas aquatica TaxID=376175 RepID=A0ABY6MTM5_9BURK|nr:glyoxylate/hydroxypyruvate reductase A [Schlegelella aquatica]UZD55350.1 glyoxylate/hydroxypyruvate reductase A [Schlegelella aquatica]
MALGKDMSMGIVVLSSPLPSAPFAEALRAAAPDIPVWTEQDDPPADEVEALLAWRLKPGIVGRYPRLRLVCSTGAGVDKLLVPDLPAGLPLTRVVDPDQAVQIAQYVLGCTLRHTRDLTLYAAQQSQRLWRRHPVRPSARCRIGILGFGAVGQAIARAFGPVGYPVTGWSRRPKAVAGCVCVHGASGLAQVLATSDVLVCALPLTAETRGLLDHRRLSALPAGAYVINVGRGEQLVEDDLRRLLDDGHLAGAALDVFEREPPPADHWVWSHPRVLATPHIAAQAADSVVAAQCVAALRAVREGRLPDHAIDRHAGY